MSVCEVNIFRLTRRAVHRAIADASFTAYTHTHARARTHMHAHTTSGIGVPFLPTSSPTVYSTHFASPVDQPCWYVPLWIVVIVHVRCMKTGQRVDLKSALSFNCSRINQIIPLIFQQQHFAITCRQPACIHGPSCIAKYHCI